MKMPANRVHARMNQLTGLRRFSRFTIMDIISHGAIDYQGKA
jgi:hypothetical protein